MTARHVYPSSNRKSRDDGGRESTARLTASRRTPPVAERASLPTGSRRNQPERATVCGPRRRGYPAKAASPDLEAPSGSRLVILPTALVGPAGTINATGPLVGYSKNIQQQTTGSGQLALFLACIAGKLRRHFALLALATLPPLPPMQPTSPIVDDVLKRRRPTGLDGKHCSRYGWPNIQFVRRGYCPPHAKRSFALPLLTPPSPPRLPGDDQDGRPALARRETYKRACFRHICEGI